MRPREHTNMHGLKCLYTKYKIIKFQPFGLHMKHIHEIALQVLFWIQQLASSFKSKKSDMGIKTESFLLNQETDYSLCCGTLEWDSIEFISLLAILDSTIHKKFYQK